MGFPGASIRTEGRVTSLERSWNCWAVSKLRIDLGEARRAKVDIHGSGRAAVRHFWRSPVQGNLSQDIQQLLSGIFLWRIHGRSREEVKKFVKCTYCTSWGCVSDVEFVEVQRVPAAPVAHSLCINPERPRPHFFFFLFSRHEKTFDGGLCWSSARILRLRKHAPFSPHVYLSTLFSSRIVIPHTFAFSHASRDRRQHKKKLNENKTRAKRGWTCPRLLCAWRCANPGKR
jgi:hypothetical protein